MTMRFQLCLSAMLVASAGSWSFAQVGNGVITGQVSDETGGMLPGATMTLRDASTGRERSTLSDSSGRFTIAGLVPGSYALSVSLSGFDTLMRESVEATGGITTINLVMKVSSLRDAVVVRGTARNVASSIAGKRAADGIVDLLGHDRPETMSSAGRPWDRS